MERQTAVKCSIEEVSSGKFYEGDREALRPSFILTKYGERIARVNIFGVITDKFISDDKNYGTLTINDFSGSIRVKAFRDEVKKIEKFNVGQNVVVIGKPRFWGDEVYIGVEIIRNVDDPNFESYRRLEILKRLIERKRIIDEVISLREKLSDEEFYTLIKEKYNFSEEEINFILQRKDESKDFKSKIVKVIKELDRGEGVNLIDIFNSINLSSTVIDRLLSELIEEGKIVEIEPGKIRVRE